jgi:hypothetical protein
VERVLAGRVAGQEPLNGGFIADMAKDDVVRLHVAQSRRAA